MGLANDPMDPRWLRDELAKRGRSQSDLARFLGVAPSAVNRMCSGQRQIKAWEADKIREYLQSPGASSGGTATPRHSASPSLEASLLPVRGIVEAGSWREVAYQEFLEQEFLPAPRSIVSSEAFALKVQGASMDLHYPAGSYVIVEPWYGGPLPVGKHVIVERERDGLIETTIKELIQTADGQFQLWPKSSHPAHQLPVRYDEHEHATVRIVAVVSWAISKVP